jgi:exosome complex exonuclease RRP6
VIRPLPDEMFYYARADTHYLLYIYDNMRNELVQKTNPEVPEENRTEIVLQKSKETSLLRYERQVYNMESGKGHGGWYNLLVKTPALFNSEQFAVFRAIHAWRDKIARLDDDSTAYVSDFLRATFPVSGFKRSFGAFTVGTCKCFRAHEVL